MMSMVSRYRDRGVTSPAIARYPCGVTSPYLWRAGKGVTSPTRSIAGCAAACACPSTHRHGYLPASRLPASGRVEEVRVSG